MDANGDVLGQGFLKDALLGSLGVLLLQSLNLLAPEEGEDADVAGGVDIGAVEPELVELVWRCALGVEPHVSALGLAELGAVGLGDERAGEGVGLATFYAADELGAGGNVAPLVGTAHLQLAALGAVEDEEVVALQQLVAELGERDAGLHAFLHAVLGHHVVDGDVLAHVADEIEEEVVLHPVVVVEYLGTVDGVVEVEEARKLPLDAVDVVLYLVGGEQFALGGLEGGVANHAGGAADDGQRLVAGHLEVLEQHDGDEVADMEAVGGGVDADVGGGYFFVELLLGAGHDVVNHTAPFKFFYKIGVHVKFKVYSLRFKV